MHLNIIHSVLWKYVLKFFSFTTTTYATVKLHISPCFLNTLMTECDWPGLEQGIAVYLGDEMLGVFSRLNIILIQLKISSLISPFFSSL